MARWAIIDRGVPVRNAYTGKEKWFPSQGAAQRYAQLSCMERARCVQRRSDVDE